MMIGIKQFNLVGCFIFLKKLLTFDDKRVRLLKRITDRRSIKRGTVMGIARDYDERRKEIVAAATTLFIQKGFEKTSVNDILKIVGIAKGTFYYYFKSKEEVLEAVVDQITLLIKSRVKDASSNQSLPADKRFFKALQAMRVTEDYGDIFLEDMHRPENALLHQKSLQSILTEIIPIFTEIVEDGIKEGIFDCPKPKQYMQILLAAAVGIFDQGIFLTDIEEQEDLLDAFQTLLTNSLGMEKERKL